MEKHFVTKEFELTLKNPDDVKAIAVSVITKNEALGGTVGSIVYSAMACKTVLASYVKAMLDSGIPDEGVVGALGFICKEAHKQAKSEETLDISKQVKIDSEVLQ